MSILLTNAWRGISELVSNLEPAKSWAKSNPYLAAAGAGTGLVGGLVLHYYLSRLKNLPPGPIGLPLIGSRLSFDPAFLHLDIHHLQEKYGDVMTIYVGSTPFVILSSLKAIKETFGSGNTFSGRPRGGVLGRITHEEIFTKTYSEDWKMKKKFGSNGVRKYGGPKSGLDTIIMKEVEWLIETFKKANGSPVRPIETFNSSTANVMVGMVYGKTYDHDSPGLKKIQQDIINFFSAINNRAPGSEFYPVWIQKIIFSGCHKVLRKNTVAMRNLCISQMDGRVKKEDTEPTCLLEHFLYKRGVEEVGGMMTFADTVALYTHDTVDTISVLLDWSMLYLAYFPEYQQKMRETIEKVVDHQDLVTLTDRPDLGFVEAFLLEVQRHCHLLTYSFGHCSTKHDTMYRGWNIPPECTVLANFYSVHMDPELHPEPEAFKPERFLKSNGTFVNSNTVLAFSLGQRKCPGEQMAMMEIFFTIANLVKHFNIVFPEDQPRPSLQMKTFGMFKTPREYKVVMQTRV